MGNAEACSCYCPGESGRGQTCPQPQAQELMSAFSDLQSEVAALRIQMRSVAKDLANWCTSQLLLEDRLKELEQVHLCKHSQAVDFKVLGGGGSFSDDPDGREVPCTHQVQKAKDMAPTKKEEVKLEVLCGHLDVLDNRIGEAIVPAVGTAKGNADEPPSLISRVHGENEVMSCMNVHAWSVLQATKHDARPCIAVIEMMLSLGFVLFQLFLLASVVLESSFTRCTAHDQCLVGEWCSPALGGKFSTEPGVCFDCWSARMLYEARFLNASYEVYPDPYEKMAAAAGDKWLLEGEQHCNSTDTMPNLCDHLQHSLKSISPLNLFVFVSTAILIVAPMLDDIDDVADLELLTADRARFMTKLRHRHIIFGIAWFGRELRRWVLPMMILGATLGLLTREPLTSANMLLNGIAITFVTTMDDTLGWVFIDPEPGVEERPKLPLPRLLWVFHRLYAVCLLAVLIITFLQSEVLLSTYGNEAKYGAVCSDIREIVTVLPFHVCATFAVLHALVQFSLRWLDKDVARRERDHRVEFCRNYADTPFMSVEMWYWVTIWARLLRDLIIPAFLVPTFRHAFVAQGPLVMLQVSDGFKSNS